MMFPTESQVKQMMRDRIQSKDWWTFLVTPGDRHFLRQVEETHYWDEKNVDFEAVIMFEFMPGLMSVVFARKVHMNTVQLVDIMNQHMADKIIADDFEAGDIICRSGEIALMARFLHWIGFEEEESETGDRNSTSVEIEDIKPGQDS